MHFDFNRTLGCVYPTLYIGRLLDWVYHFSLLICYPPSYNTCIHMYNTHIYIYMYIYIYIIYIYVYIYMYLYIYTRLLITQSGKTELIFFIPSYLYIFVFISRNWKIFHQFILFLRNGNKLKWFTVLPRVKKHQIEKLRNTYISTHCNKME